jgi:predicted oxidoreductase
VSRIAYGCAALVKFDQTPLNHDALVVATRAAYDNGITFFDLADHYGFFKSEAAFGEILKRSPGFREKIVIQSKCGVLFRDDWQTGSPSHYFDCSYQNIINSVEGSLRRLHTGHLDILLLHYPDALVEPEEVAKAFDKLWGSGKVRHFGVSNHTASQIELLRRCVHLPLVTNQIPLGLARPDVLADGLRGNQADSTRVTGIIDYCRLHSMSVQAYSSLRGELLNPAANAGAKVKEAAQVLRQIADRRSATPWSIALSWLLRHPATIIPILGSTNPEHICQGCAADEIRLDHDEWYRLLVAATDALPMGVLR